MTSLLNILTQQQIEEPLRYAPPEGFPDVDEIYRITYSDVPQGVWEQLWAWLEAHQTAVLLSSAGLFLLAVLKPRRRR